MASNIERLPGFVVTGGPGSGKSTLVAALRRQGVFVMPEAGRAIIRDQVEIGGTALPWADRAAFAELMLAWDIRSFREAQAIDAPVVFDRGVPDTLGYLTLCGMEPPAHVACAADLFRYHIRVFIAPPWPEIFGQDEERKQSLAEAGATHEVMAETYGRLGYELIALPKATVAERARFVMSRLGR